MDNAKKSLSLLSFCTGLRGLERGVERVIGSLRTVAFVEIEAFIIANLVAQMESGFLAPCPIWTNLKTFPSKEFYGKVHVVTAGYPCQPFSHAGRRLGTEDPRHLWPFIKQHIEAIRPVLCFFENVPGHLTLGYETVKSDLEELGYSVKEGIYSAEEVGAPHLRERLFILAVMAHTICNNGEEIQNKERHSGFGSKFMFNGDSWRTNRFPARRGQTQFEWEEPRVVKSCMGSTINGYNFREDLLRGLGNAVVEQTAELAFRYLLTKHIKINDKIIHTLKINNQ